MSEYERIRAVFEEVMDLPPERRREEAGRLTVDDPTLRSSVLGLLDDLSEADEAGFLSAPILGGSILLGAMPREDGEPSPEIPGYALGEVIGFGSSGTVYRGRSTGPLERDVAVKVLRRGLPEGVRLRFQREQRALAQLNHPGVAQVYDAGESADGRPFVAVELVDGSWITRHAEDAGLGWRERVELMIEVCAAVHAIHTNGVLHRDLKPANILVARGEGRARAKVIDFGASAFVDSTQSIAAEGPRVVGTLAFLAPELLARAERGDARSDVFALGVILHELLTGSHPFGVPEAPLAELVRRITEAAPPGLPASLGPDRVELQIVIAKACQRDASERYASTQHLGDDLRRVLEKLPVEARAPSAVRELRSALRRHPWSAAAGGAAVVALIAMSVVLARSAQRNARQAEAMRQTVDVLVEGVLDEMSELSGANAAREGLATLLLDRIEDLPRDAMDAGMTRQRARVLQSLSEVALDRGDAARAVELRRAAIGILAPMAEAEGASRDLVDELLVLRIQLGDALVELGRVEEGVGVYRAAHHSIEARLEESPRDVRLRDELCWSYERIAFHAMRKDPQEAMRLCEARLVVARALHEEAPEDPMRIFGLGCAEFWCGRVLLEMGDASGALGHAERSISLTARAAQSEPHRFAFRSREIIARTQHLRTLMVLDDPSVPARLREAIAIARAFRAANPDSETAEFLLENLDYMV
ncbi:MAG: serine/threonine-protein kinase, partial [Planctomycetota bacterium]|nr:serine/threonine-protein kinase [Planctomycetota bacterium]